MVLEISLGGTRFGKVTEIVEWLGDRRTCPWRIHKIMRPLESGITLDSASATRMNGKLIGMGHAGLSYDAENRVTATSSVSGGAEQYANGPDNQRIWKLKSDGSEEMYYYDLQGHRVGTYPIYPNPLNLQNGYY